MDAMPSPEDHASATTLAQAITAYKVGARANVGASWAEGRRAKGGEITVPMTLTPALILYRNRRQPWPGFYISGYEAANGEVWVHARDIGFDAARVFEFFNLLMGEVGAYRFMPDASTYPGHMLYRVRYLR